MEYSFYDEYLVLTVKVLKAGVFIFPGSENEVLEHWETHIPF
jgi:hypothetical protein